MTEADRSFDVTLLISEFYVNPPLTSPRKLKKELGTVRFRPTKALGPVTISRRSAAEDVLTHITGTTDTHAARDREAHNSTQIAALYSTLAGLQERTTRPQRDAHHR